MKRFRIGVLALHTTSDYPHSLCMGIRNALEEAGHTMVYIADLIPYHTLHNTEAYLRVAVEIAGRLDLDLVIAPAGCMTAYLKGDTAKAVELIQKLDPNRTLVLEREVEEFRCINKDSAPGMHECMRHLIETCGFTKIGFVSGPATSKGAHERETVYFEEMAAHGLEASPSLFVRGDFGGACADVIDGLIQANPDMEAICCACDLIAYTTYEVMRKRELTVGVDLAVTGFDDNPRSRHMDPPLSTVRMTGYDFGYLAGCEAIRMCEGLPQQNEVISSSFVARSSCGEETTSTLDYACDLLRQKPFPTQKFVDIILDSTLDMAGRRVTEDFRSRVTVFLDKVRQAYLHHLARPHEEVALFSSDDLATLLSPHYQDNLSLEGFHTAAITLLEALLEVSPEEDTLWVIKQLSHLHLRIARLLGASNKDTVIDLNKQEWVTFHTVDDALREDKNLPAAYELILSELAKLGVNEADLFLLPETVEFIGGARAFALSDSLIHLGSLSGGKVALAPASTIVMLQDLLATSTSRYLNADTFTVCGIMAGNELLGIAVLQPGNLSEHGQLMALLNLGFACKHLSMIAEMRDMNELLNQNNLLLQQESQHDDMTGLLNRRGFHNSVMVALPQAMGELATVLYLDLDGLKYINDVHGHDAGDEAIRATARILSSCMPPKAALCRLGGDEFVAFVPLMGEDEAIAIAQHIQAKMHAFNASSSLPFDLSISLGSTTFSVDKTTEERMPKLMVTADERLYEMKRQHHESRRFGSA